MKKRIISVLCVFLFIGLMGILLVISNPYVINLHDIDKADTWQEAYCNCLDEYEAERCLVDIWDVEASEVTTLIMLKNLDDDTIPELWVVDVMSAPEVTEQISYDLDVYSFVNGKAERVGGCEGTEIQYAMDGGKIWSNSIRQIGAKQSCLSGFYHYVNGAWVQDIMLFDGFEAGDYEIDGCPVTKEEYDGQMELYTQGDYRTIQVGDGVVLNRNFVGESLNKAIEQTSGNAMAQLMSRMCIKLKDMPLHVGETIFYKERYSEYLENYIKSNDYMPGINKFMFAYIDEDMVPELLIIQSDGLSDGVIVHRLIGDEVVELGEYGQRGELEYLKNTGLVRGHFFHMGQGISYTYKIENSGDKELLRSTCFFFDENGRYIEEAVSGRYEVEGTEVSEEEYETAEAKLYPEDAEWIWLRYENAVYLEEDGLEETIESEIAKLQ